MNTNGIVSPPPICMPKARTALAGQLIGSAEKTQVPLRIFLVEDSAILRDRIVETFAAWGNLHIVGHAETESVAEAALRTQDWDILILDLQLLQGTGLGVLKSLRSHRKPGTVVIVFTNYAIPSYHARSMELGADYFFDKANDIPKMKEVFEALAERKKNAEQRTSIARRRPS